LTGAGLGYGLSQIASDPNLSTGQKVGHSVRGGTDAALAALVPYYGAGKAVNIVGKQLERSGSPQVRGAGRALDYAVEPSGAKGFWDVVQGDKSPAKAFSSNGGLEGLTLDMMGPVGIVLRGLGVRLPFLSSTP